MMATAATTTSVRVAATGRLRIDSHSELPQKQSRRTRMTNVQSRGHALRVTAPS
jgi:hypothetical protein